jgi:hypothetical protein
MEAVDQPLVIRPNAAVFARRVAIGLAVAWPLLVFRLVVGSHQLGYTIATLLGASTVGVLALVACAYFLNVRVVVTDDQVILRGFSGRQRRWPRRIVQGCVLVSVLIVGSRRPDRVIVVHGANRQTLFTLNGALWDEHAVRALTHALGYRHNETATFKGPLTRQEYLESYPGAAPFGYKHLWAVVLVGGVLIPLIVIFGAVEITDLVSHR